MGVMCSKDTVCEEGIQGEERIEDIEGTESDTEIVTELGGRERNRNNNGINKNRRRESR